MFSGVDSPAIVPSYGSVTRQRLPSVGSLGRLSPLLRYYALLRLLVIHPALPQLTLGSAVPSEKKNLGRKRRDLPGYWVTLCSYAALYDPGRIFVPSHEDEPARGVAVNRRLSPAISIAAGASFRTVSLSRRLAAPRCGPRSTKRRGRKQQVRFRGSITRPQRSLSTLRSPPHDGTTQDSLAAGGQPLLRGIGYPPGYIQGFSVPCFLLGQACLAQFVYELTIFVLEGLFCDKYQRNPVRRIAIRPPPRALTLSVRPRK